MNPIRVLIVDDSAVVRRAISEVLESDPQIQIMATAADPLIAAERIRGEVPDVIVLDVEMPRMDGLTFLQAIMTQHPIPVVICSTLSEKGSETALRAMEYGAVDVVAKPRLGTEQFLRESRELLCGAVKAASQVRPRAFRPVEPSLTADAVLERAAGRSMAQTTEKVVLVGASTGGTEALRAFLMRLPSDAPGIVIVQHMPEKFTAAFAGRLDGLCAISVKEAENGDAVLRGRALIAPGNRHTLLKRSGARYFVRSSGWAAGVPPQAFGGRPVPVGSALRGQERRRCADDRYGKRWGPRPAGIEAGRGRNDRAGRSHLRRIRYAA